MIRNISSLTIHHHPMTTTPTPDLISTSDFVREALKDAVLVSMLLNSSKSSLIPLAKSYIVLANT
jgi:hypothetical protein